MLRLPSKPSLWRKGTGAAVESIPSSYPNPSGAPKTRLSGLPPPPPPPGQSPDAVILRKVPQGKPHRITDV